ncbi:citrate/2-methylcitrate synthase [Actinomadura sp. DC4]|uniref:citrate/2-methylcitrate synthase n=1 Tax=Actinomadura sp. DC4 TaxID=3055069 RepID=UPI0025B08225|nr:citrate/2-methylcitrate synthase [Actinomadura sp. DC4]MDN3352377.1 citrate/2-methylcitrate synthase [Actinomadura sp. DC4]
MDAASAAERLGVKTATLYAYVSRGVLRRRHSPDGRRSLFDPAEVEELARRGRPRRPPGRHEMVIESQLTVLGEDRPYYRGRDALRLAEAHAFEDVAHWLWTGERGGPDEWRAGPEAVDAARAAQSGLPTGTLPLERLQVITVALATADPLRLNLDPPAVAAAGRNLIAGMCESLPPEAAAPEATSIPARLWSRLTSAEPRPELVGALRAALVLLADHELAASTLAVRVAASVRADPYAAVGAGLGVLGGTLHGGASLGAEALFAEIDLPRRAARVVGERLRRGDRVPGFGGSGLYTRGDGRGRCLLEIVRAAAPGHPRVAVAEAILIEARARRLPEPNIDFALATLAAVAGMVRGSGEAVYAVARTAGWLAHALEEYARETPLRPRAVYTGPRPEVNSR